MYAAAGTRTTLPQRIKLALVAATLMLSLGIGVAGTAQPVGATAPNALWRPKTLCMIITDGDTWYAATGYRADADWVGGMFCYKQ